MSRPLVSLACACVTLLLISRTSSLSAGKPAPPPPPPPPPAPAPETIYEDRRADLGGWLDTSRNLIWGMPVSSISGGSASYDTAVNETADYANVLEDGSLWHYQESLRYESLGDQYSSTDPARAQIYYDRADDYGATAVELAASATVASQFTNWRMPTKDEAADAAAKGFFTYTPNWGVWDISPLPGLQPQTTYLLYWTTTASGKRNQWAFDPASGASQTVLKDRSYLNFVAVRSHSP